MSSPALPVSSAAEVVGALPRRSHLSILRPSANGESVRNQDSDLRVMMFLFSPTGPRKIVTCYGSGD